MENEIDYDVNLWFYHKGCEGKHFLFGNPHTFPGRMWAWCEVKKRSFFVSKSEMGECSEQTTYWVKGFLAGNQPDAPTDENGDVDYKSAEYKNWLRKLEEFEETGFWEIAD